MAEPNYKTQYRYDFIGGGSISDIEPLAETGQGLKDQVEIDRSKAAAADANFSWSGLFHAAPRSTLTGQLWNTIGQSTPAPDPAFTFERYKQRLSEASKIFTDEELWTLRNAHSDAHFDQLMTNALALQKAKKELEEGGWPGWFAQTAAEFLDPVSNAIAMQTYKMVRIPMMRIPAFAGSRAGRIGAEVIAGAAAGASMPMSAQVLKMPVSEIDYVTGAGVGALFGGAIGLAQNPATAQEAAALVQFGRKMVQKVEESVGRRIKKEEPTTQASVARAAEIPKQEAASPAIPDVPPRIEPAPDTAPSVDPAKPTEADALKVIPKLQREGPESLIAQLRDYQRKFGDEALISEARANGFKKIKPGQDIPEQILEAAKRKIVDTYAAARDPGSTPPTWESVSARMQDGWQTAADGIAQGKAPEEAIQDALTAAGRVADDAPAQAPKPAERPISETIQKLAENPNQPIPDDITQQLADALDQLPPVEPGKAKQLPTPKALLADRYHVAEYEGADGKIYRIRAGQENGLGPYRVIDVNSKKTIGRDIEDLKKARDLIPGANEEYNPAKAAARAQLLQSRMTPGPPAKPILGGWEAQGFKVIRSSDDPGLKHLTLRDANNNQIGEIELTPLDSGQGHYVSWITVDPDYQGGRGALALLKAGEAEVGGALFPDSTYTPDGYQNFGRRIPWVKEWYRNIPGYTDDYYSPRQLLRERDGLVAQLADPGLSPKARERSQKALNMLDQVWKDLPEEAKKIENIRQMAALRNETPTPGTLRPEARRDVVKLLQRALPKQVSYEIVPEAFQGMTGSYDPVTRLVKVALTDYTSPIATAWHEVVHALRGLGQFTRQEWDAMVRYARDAGAHERYRLNDYIDFYKKQGVDDAGTRLLIDEEAVAYTMQEYAKGSRVGGWAQELYDRAILSFRAFKQALGLSKWNTNEKAFDSVFRRIRLGDTAQRPEGYGPTVVDDFMASRAQLDAGAQQASAVTQNFLQDPNWKAVGQDDVPYTAGFWRFDRAGFLGKRENPLTRMIGTTFLNDTVGKADHSVNPFSADLDQIRVLNTWLGEYNRYRKPALQEWMDDMKIPPLQRVTAQDGFYEQVGEYVAARNEGAEYHPAVVRLGDAVRRIQAEILEDLKNPMRREGLEGRPIKGSEDVETHKEYLWRKFDYGKVNGAITQYKQSGVEKMVMGAIKKAQPDIPEQYLEQLARGYVMNLRRRGAGIQDEWSIALGESNYEKFRKLLTEETHLAPEEVEDIIARMQVQRPEGGTMVNLRRRVLLSEDYVERNLPHGDGVGASDLAFRHLLDNNIDRVFSHYARRASGRVAMGRVQIRAPRFGDKLVDGITSDAEFERIKGFVQKYGGDMGMDPAEITRDLDHLQFAYDRIIGNPDPRQTNDTAGWFRRIRMFNVTRLMGQVGIAQAGETGTIVGSLGVKASFQHVPAYKRIITQAGESRLRNELFDEIEHLGIGVERLHGWGYHNLEDIGDMPFEARRWDRGEVIDRNLKLLERGTYELSGMSLIQQQQERFTAAAVAQKIANMAVKPTPSRSDLRRMAQLGVDEEMLQRVMRGLREHADTTDGILFNNRINRLNLHNWTDLEARAALENAMFRMTRKLVQSGDVGNTALWMSNPIWQTLFQFRSFAFTAWSNQFLYNLHMRDFNAFSSMLWSTAWAATVRAMQVQALASTRSDGETWKQKQLDPWELGKAGFSRAGWSSIIPMVIDTGVSMTGNPGMFNARSSGQPSDIMFGSPVTSLVDNAIKGTGGIVNSAWTGRPISQPELRTAFGILPFSNMIPMTMALSHLIKDLPEKAPPKQRNSP